MRTTSFIVFRVGVRSMILRGAHVGEAGGAVGVQGGERLGLPQCFLPSGLGLITLHL